ncbi:hypothetical protein BVX97_05820 [bacterium E08(2017)]|nr:hypothetical protein BVX97_05820 [bacterium E08(2017)]
MDILKKTVVVMVVMVMAASIGMAEGKMKMSAKAEIWVEASKDIDSNKEDSKIKANELYLSFDGKFDNDISSKVKLDGADIVSSDGKTVTEKIVEEANFTFKNVGGTPVTLILGKDEMPFGQDYDKMLSDPLVHNFEIDKVWGVNSSVAIAGVGSIGAATYYHRNSADGRVEADNAAGDNYAVRLKADKLIKNIALSVSMAQESYASTSVTADDGTTTATTKDDETRIGAAALVTLDSANIALEYVGFENRKGKVDYNPGLVSLAADVKVTDTVKLHGKYEKILEDSADDVEEDFYAVGIEIAAADGLAVFVEYLNYNSSDLKDASDLSVADGSLEDSVKVGIRGKF